MRRGLKDLRPDQVDWVTERMEAETEVIVPLRLMLFCFFLPHSSAVCQVYTHAFSVAAEQEAAHQTHAPDLAEYQQRCEGQEDGRGTSQRISMMKGGHRPSGFDDRTCAIPRRGEVVAKGH